MRVSRNGAILLSAGLMALGAGFVFAVTVGKTIVPPPSAPPAVMIMRVEEPPEAAPAKDLHKLLAQDSEVKTPDPPKPEEKPEPVPPKHKPKPKPKPEPKPEPKQEQKTRPKPVREKTKRPPAPSASPESPREAVAAAPSAELSGSAAPGPVVTESRAESDQRDRLLARLLSAIEKRKHYPRKARRSRTEGTATLEVRVDASGTVTACSLARSSGASALDAATSGLGEKLVGFDTGVRGKPLGVRVPVRYDLTE